MQKYMRHARTPRRVGQNWATFLRNHAKDIWACDFLQVTGLFFRSLLSEKEYEKDVPRTQ